MLLVSYAQQSEQVKHVPRLLETAADNALLRNSLSHSTKSAKVSRSASCSAQCCAYFASVIGALGKQHAQRYTAVVEIHRNEIARVDFFGRMSIRLLIVF